MKPRSYTVRAMALLAAVFCALLLATTSASADNFNTDFETYTVGNINGQDGWMKTGSFDAAIVNQASLSLSYAGFGSRSLRISNAVTSGSFGDQTFSKSLANEAGETSAQNGGLSGGARQPYYEASFDFASANPAVEQTGLMVGVSPDRGDGARMSLFRLYDLPAGLAVEFFDFDRDRAGTCADGLDFASTMVATDLARGAVHNVRITMQFVDGIDNDVVKVYVDGNLVHTGQSWEDYFVDCEPNPTRTVDSLLFRASGTAQPTLAGKGFLIDNFKQYSGPVPCTTTCYADAVGGSDSNGGTSPADAFKTIQKAIDTVQAGGEVRVLPGTYSETASNRFVLGVNGPHAFGLFIDKDITIQGVTAGDVAITDPSATQARVETNSTANFGPDGIFVQGDGVTIAGLEIGTNCCGQNKTIEIIGDAFTLKDSFVNDPQGSVYFNDWQFNTGTNTSHVQSYTIDNNIFASGVSIDLTSGAGLSGPVSGRQITDNAFEMSPGETWPAISFTGSGTGVEWFVQSVGGAVITGNTFKNTSYGAVQWIRARGDYDNTQFNWASYWNDNTYDNAVVFGPNLLTDLGTYSYTSGSYTFNHVRRIGATIQPEVDHATAGDTVMVAPGTYPENVVVNKSLTINGANAGVSPNDSVNPLNPNGARGPESEVTVTGGGGAFRVGAANVTIDGFKFTDANVALADVQTPLIGAGGNFGGDAPGVKVLNNLFYQTNRMLVYFNGPVLMQGGTIDDNRAQNPGRPDTGCGTAPALAPGGCAHQLFNPWATQNLSFQRNVIIGTAGSGDRIRTLNISRSADSLIADNTVRYACTYTCFNIASDVGGDVEVTGNDIVTDVGNVIQIHSTWTTLGAEINVHHNILTTGNDYPIVVDDLDADLDNVHINRNAITGSLHVRNGALPSSPGAETLDVTCNWWGSAAGPNPANFFGPSDFDPWLSSSNLDGPCAISGYLFSAEMPGTVDNVAYGSEDVLRYDPVTDDWSVWFDGSAHNLIAKKNTHNINGIYVPDPSQPAFYLTFTQNKRVVPGVGQKVDGMDIVYWNGTAYSLFFDGSDVGLTNLTKEKIDAFDILPGNMSPINGGACLNYILISLQNSGSVPNYSGGQLKFSGEDVLGFCMTASGTVTAGKWHMWLDGSTQGMQAQSTNNIDVSPDAQMLYFTTHKNFNADTAVGNHSMVYVYSVATQSFSGPIFKAADHGFLGKTDAMQLIFD